MANSRGINHSYDDAGSNARRKRAQVPNQHSNRQRRASNSHADDRSTHGLRPARTNNRSAHPNRVSPSTNSKSDRSRSSRARSKTASAERSSHAQIARPSRNLDHRHNESRDLHLASSKKRQNDHIASSRRSNSSTSSRSSRRSDIYVKESFSSKNSAVKQHGVSIGRTNAHRSTSRAVSPKLMLYGIIALVAVILLSILAFNVYLSDIEKQKPREKLLNTDVASFQLVTSSFNLINAFDGIEEAINAFKDANSNVGFYVQTVTGNTILSYNADKEFYSASSIKGPYVLSVASDSDIELSNSMKATIEDAIIESSNEAYYTVKEEYGVKDINRWLAVADSSTAIGRDAYSFLNISPKQLAALWQQSWDYISTPSEQQEWLSVTFSEPKNSVIADLEEATTWSKPGWILDGSYQSTVDAGIVERGTGAYIISVMTDKGNDFKLVRQMVNAIDAYIQAMPESLIEAPELVAIADANDDSVDKIMIETATDDSSNSSENETIIEVSESDDQGSVETEDVSEPQDDQRSSSQSSEAKSEPSYRINIKD